MDAIASQITSLTIVYSIVYSDADQRKHQSSASLAFVRGIHRGPVNSPHKWPVTRKMFPFDDVIMCCRNACRISERLFDFKPISRGYLFPRDLLTKRFVPKWMEAKIYHRQVDRSVPRWHQTRRDFVFTTKFRRTYLTCTSIEPRNWNHAIILHLTAVCKSDLCFLAQVFMLTLQKSIL